MAAGWGLAAAALRDPDAEVEAALRDGAFAAEAGAALDSLDSLDPDGARRLAAAWARYREALLRAGAAGALEERARVFGHAVRGPCPPYELEYGDEHFLGKSHRLGDVAAFYRAFGVEVARAARERSDHAAVEAEFLAFLLAKVDAAEGRGEAEGAAVCREAAGRFLAEHLGRFLPALARRVSARSPGGVLDGALRFALAVAEIHASAEGIPLGDPELDLREVGTVEEESLVSCGSGDPLAAAVSRTGGGGVEV